MKRVFVLIPRAVVMLGVLALAGCPDGGDGDSWSVSFHGDANAGDNSPSGLQIGFHISW